MRNHLRANWLLSLTFCVAMSASVALAAPHELRIPFGGDVPNSACLGAVNAALKGSCQMRVEGKCVVLEVDPEKLPTHSDDLKRAIRVFTRDVAPSHAREQASRWGIFIPNRFDPHQPLVLLVHGLDSDPSDLALLGGGLSRAGCQVGYFAYPCDQPIEESGRYFAEQMENLRQQYPGVVVNVVAHSMGGLVTRSFVEGPDYAGGINHLILIGTPNAGSSWAAAHLLLKAEEQIHEAQSDPKWHWTWAITEGLGEAGGELESHSKFLKQLNARPRRAGIRYTLIAGDQTPVRRYSADVADRAVKAVPKRIAGWWGVSRCAAAVKRCGEHLRNEPGKSDGPVALKSAQLAGVTDMVILHADHITLIAGEHGNPPAALETILNRLGN